MHIYEPVSLVEMQIWVWARHEDQAWLQVTRALPEVRIISIRQRNAAIV